MSDAPLVRQTARSLSVVLGGTYSRQLAHGWIDKAQDGLVASISDQPRTLGQNDKFWTVCSLLAQSDVIWDGERRSKIEWHDLLLHGWLIATGTQARLVAGLEGGRVSLGLSSHSLSKSQMSELLDYSISWATSHGIEVGLSGEAR